MIYIPLLAVTLVLAVLMLRKKERWPTDNTLLFLALMLMGWQLSLTLFQLTATEQSAKVMYDMDIPFVAFATLAYFLFVVRFYGLESYFPRAITVCLFVIPSFTAVIAATSTLHPLFRPFLEILSLEPTHEVHTARGPWFWLHAFYCYLLVVAALIITILQHRQTPKLYRLPSMLIMIGMVTSAMGNILVLTGIFPFDLSLVTITIALVFLYLATKRNRGVLFYRTAQREVFNYLSQAILVLDDERKIVSVNRAAERLLSLSKDLSDSGTRVEDTLGPLLSGAERTERLEDEKAGIDYCLKDDVVINLREKPMLDRRGDAIGRMVVLENVTENRRLIRTLDEISGTDVLTGLNNRRRMTELMAELDREENLPITVIAGDLNNLKQVNDTLGHQQGDMLLRISAETLSSSCPPSAHVGRVGGDEFLILLANYSASRARELIASIKQTLINLDNYAFVPSMALGYSVKEVAAQDLQHTADMADADMYRDKVRTKTAELNRVANTVPDRAMQSADEEPDGARESS